MKEWSRVMGVDVCSDGMVYISFNSLIDVYSCQNLLT